MRTTAENQDAKKRRINRRNFDKFCNVYSPLQGVFASEAIPPLFRNLPEESGQSAGACGAASLAEKLHLAEFAHNFLWRRRKIMRKLKSGLEKNG